MVNSQILHDFSEEVRGRVINLTAVGIQHTVQSSDAAAGRCGAMRLYALEDGIGSVLVHGVAGQAPGNVLTLCPGSAEQSGFSEASQLPRVLRAAGHHGDHRRRERGTWRTFWSEHIDGRRRIVDIEPMGIVERRLGRWHHTR